MFTSSLLSLALAIGFVNGAVIEKRVSVVTTSTTTTQALPSGWSNSGACLAEVAGRALTGATYSGTDMTQANCATYCASKGYTLAGLEFSSQCFCGSVLSNSASLTKTSTGCNMKCKGDSSSICGGSNAITLLVSQDALNTLSADLSSSPITLPSGWAAASTSCVAEGTTGRALTSAKWLDNSMTIGTCIAFCQSKGFSYAGVEFGRECYCGNSLSNGASLDKPSSGCTMTCSADKAHTCGGSNALQLYYQAPALPQGWSVASTSCIAEGSSGRALVSSSWADDSMTIGKCLNYCQERGSQYAGVEYGRECYCGDSLVNGASLSIPSTNCYKPCAGESSRTCGGPNALQLYINPSLANNLQVDGSYSYQGCIMEVDGRALTGNSTASDDMTIGKCTSFCQSGGYQFAGVEYGRECYCGNSFSNGASASAWSNECYMKCAGNTKQGCGGPNAISLWRNPSLSF